VVQIHFSVIPSYLFLNVPASGLSLLTGELPSENHHHNDFRWRERSQALGITAISRIPKHVRAALQTVRSCRFNPFVFDEIYHDFAFGTRLRRNRAVPGADLPINRFLCFNVLHPPE
jgi:hypothetical protein